MIDKLTSISTKITLHEQKNNIVTDYITAHSIITSLKCIFGGLYLLVVSLTWILNELWQKKIPKRKGKCKTLVQTHKIVICLTSKDKIRSLITFGVSLKCIQCLLKCVFSIGMMKFVLCLQKWWSLVNVVWLS